MKLTNEEKVQMYTDWRIGLSFKELCKKYNIGMRACEYTCHLVKRHGIKILYAKRKTSYTKEFKQELVDLVLKDNRSMSSVSIDYGLTNKNTLYRWVKNFIENGYTVIEKRPERTAMAKNKKETEISRLEQLEKENLYLRAENEYLKKLDALVRKNRAEEQKKQK